MGLLFFFFFTAIFFSFLCSIVEAVLLSITHAYIGLQQKENPTLAQRLKAYKHNIDRPLAGILTLNTFAHTLGAAGVGAQISQLLEAENISTIILPFLEWRLNYVEFWGSIAGVALTLAILVFSEIIPKTLGANYWERLVPFTVKTIDLILITLAPLINLSQFITQRLKKDQTQSVFNRAEWMAMAEIGQEIGAFQPSESKILQNLIRFEEIRVRDVMTPRSVVVMEHEDLTIRAFYEKHKNLRFSRIPIYGQSIDNIHSFILKDELLVKIINQEDHLHLKDIKRNITIVPEGMPIPKAFEKLMEKREHIALVVDEFGGMEGIVTMEDIIETLLGMEIMDESDNIEDMQALARKNWEKRAKKLGIVFEPATDFDKND